MGKTLGGGASALLIDNEPVLPATNYRKWRILSQKPDEIVFVLEYPQWNFKGQSIALSKKFTLKSDSYFVKCEDTYTFSGPYGETLPVVAGINRHKSQNTIQDEYRAYDRYAIWEDASDQSGEPEDGKLGVAVYVPGATVSGFSKGEEDGIVGRKVKSGETFTYYFGSCWSKADVKTASEWFDKVKEQEMAFR